MEEIRIHGYGGQGAVTLALLVAGAAAQEGFYVQTLPFFGVERRGAPVKAAVRIAKEEILLRSQVTKPDLLVVMSDTLLERALEEGLRESGRILVNTTNNPDLPYQVKTVDATGIALAENLVKDDIPFINIPMFGAMCAHLGIPVTAMEEAIRQKWSGNAAQKNIKVATLAYHAVEQR